MTPRFPGRPLLLIALIACGDERPRSHVYSSPPPRAATPPTEPVAPPSPQRQSVGAEGPHASIIGVVDAATGSPIALDHIDTPIDVVTVVVRGATDGLPERVRVELRAHGVQDTTLVFELGAPAPSIAAHAFRISVGDEVPGAIRTGRYTLQVRIVGGDGNVRATSMPLDVELTAHR